MRVVVDEATREAVRRARRETAELARRMLPGGGLAPPRPPWVLRPRAAWKGRVQWWRSSWSEENGGHYGPFKPEPPHRAAELRRALWYRRTEAAKEAIRHGR